MSCNMGMLPGMPVDLNENQPRQAMGVPMNPEARWDGSMGPDSMRYGTMHAAGNDAVRMDMIRMGGPGCMNMGAAVPRETLMKQLNEASFAMDEASLFLDTHPDCAEALQYYRTVNNMRQSALNAYERQYGPLFIDHVTGNTWSWLTEKWPWEGGC